MIKSPKTERHWRFIALDARPSLVDRLGIDRTLVVRRPSDLGDAFKRVSTESVWIVPHGKWAEKLAVAANEHLLHFRQHAMPFGDLLMFEPSPRPELVPSLRNYFGHVVGEVAPLTFLPFDQMAEVLLSEKRRDLFIAGSIDIAARTLTLARGDLNTMTVPIAAIGQLNESDYKKFRLDDFGYAVCFGDFEASAHGILYEFDPDYRKRFAASRRAQDKGFGPSLKRLRLLRRLPADAFPGIPEQTLTKIEEGKAMPPRGKALQTIATLLSVSPEEIETF